MRTICGTILVAAMAVGGVGSADTFADKDGSCPISTNVRGHENIEWSTSYGGASIRIKVKRSREAKGSE
jgi:hypothetical protein